MKRLFLILLCIVSLLNSTIAQTKSEIKVEKFLNAQDTAKAIKTLNKHLKKNPLNEVLYLRRAKIKIIRKDYDPAMADLNSYTSIATNHHEAEFLKGSIRFRQGDYAGALDHFEKVKLEPFEEQALVYTGLAYMWLYQQTYAEVTFKKTLKKYPNSTSALYNAAVQAYRMESYEYADGLIDRFLKIKPDDFDAQLTKSLILTKREKYIESNLLLREMLKTNNLNATINYSIGVNYYHLDERDLSCDYFRRARDLGHEAAKLSLRNYCKGR